MMKNSRIAALCFALLSAFGAEAATITKFTPYWAWDNDWGGGKFNWKPATGTNPQWSAWFNFSTYRLWGYPSSIRGWHYGNNPTGDALFPKQLSATKTIPAEFSYSSSGTNMAGDFAYDLFLRWDNQHANPQLEVMIWGGNNSTPIGKVVQSGILTHNGVTYDLWGGINTNAGYYVYTFLPQRKAEAASLPTSGSIDVDLMAFFKVLQGHNNFDMRMYLDAVEAGCEVTRGNGSVATTWFKVDAR